MSGVLLVIISMLFGVIAGVGLIYAIFLYTMSKRKW